MQNKELVCVVEKVLKSMEGAVEGSEAVDHGRRERREEQGACVVQQSGREILRMKQKRGRVGLREESFKNAAKKSRRPCE